MLSFDLRKTRKLAVCSFCVIYVPYLLGSSCAEVSHFLRIIITSKYSSKSFLARAGGRFFFWQLISCQVTKEIFWMTIFKLPSSVGKRDTHFYRIMILSENKTSIYIQFKTFCLYLSISPYYCLNTWFQKMCT